MKSYKKSEGFILDEPLVEPNEIVKINIILKELLIKMVVLFGLSINWKKYLMVFGLNLQQIIM